MGKKTKEPTTQTITVNGSNNSVSNVIHIKQFVSKSTVKNTTPQPTESNISQVEAAEVKALIDNLGGSGVSFGFIYKTIYKKFKVTSYHLIRKQDMQAVVLYLRKWIGSQRGQNGAKKPSGKAWRNDQYSAIKANITSGVYSKEELESYVENNFGKSSLSLVSNEELKQTRKWANRLRAKHKRTNSDNSLNSQPIQKQTKASDNGFKVNFDWENIKGKERDEELNKRGGSKLRNDYFRYLLNQRIEEVECSKEKAMKDIYIEIKKRFPSLKAFSSFRAAVTSN